jgi:type VI secretion system secreted protein VgrG
MPQARQTDMAIDLGDEQVVLERIESVEALSEDFLIAADIISPLEIDLGPHLGKPCHLRVREDDELVRHFDGLLVAATHEREETDGHHYRLTLMPWTYFIDQNRQMAIFQDKTAIEIIREVLLPYEERVDYTALSRPRDKRIYTVQYRESDFAFVRRLMEEEGIYFFYRHHAGGHRLVLCESPQAHRPGNPEALTYNPNSVSVFNVDSGVRFDEDGGHFLQSWSERVSTVATSSVILRDFDFTEPGRPLDAEFVAEGKHPSDESERFDYPGRYQHDYLDHAKAKGFGRDKAQAALEALRADRRVFTGTSQATGVSVGDIVKIARHPVGRFNASYLVTRAEHSIAAESYRSGQRGQEQPYNVRFEAIPADTRFQSPRVIPRPRTHGLESAFVTGPQGEEIYTDEFGRVKVRFHWDRGEAQHEKTSCWIRVSQTGGLGNVILPRVGHEVLVDFLDGDPDRPIVVGRVFNRQHMPLYKLPEHKTRALWRTKRYGDTGRYPDTKALDTGEPGANEIRFEDKGGHEEIFVHAERDMNSRIRFDESIHVGHNQEVMIGFDRTEYVGRDEVVQIGRHQTDTIAKNRKQSVGVDETLDVGSNQTETVGAKRSTKVGSSDQLTVGTSLKVDAGTTIAEQAPQSITLTSGPSSIKIDPSGITIKGPIIKIEATAILDAKGAITNVSGSAMVTVKGGIIMIN